MQLNNFNDAKTLAGRTVEFKATCELFPPQGVKGKVVRIEMSKSGEVVYIVKTPKRGLEISVGAKTAGLTAKFYSSIVLPKISIRTILSFLEIVLANS